MCFLTLQYNAVHCVVTSAGLAPAIATCMLFGLDAHVPIAGIVNTKNCKKADGFRRILDK
jgi:hypothetical protein